MVGTSPQTPASPLTPPLPSPGPGNLLLPWIRPRPGAGARGDRTPLERTVPHPTTRPPARGDTTPSHPLPSRLPTPCETPENGAGSCTSIPPWPSPSPDHPQQDRGAGYWGPPQAVPLATPPGSHTLPRMGTWGHAGRWHRSPDAVFFCFSQPGFSSEQRGPSRRAGQEGGSEQDWGKNQPVWSKLGPGRGISTALGTAGHREQLRPPRGWDDFPKHWVWGSGWPQKWGFCSQKEFSSAPGWMKQRQSGSVRDAPAHPEELDPAISILPRPLRTWGHGGGATAPRNPPASPPSPPAFWGGVLLKVGNTDAAFDTAPFRLSEQI